MAADPARQIPWCTLFLVIGALTSQTFVLIGNLKTAAVMNEIGASTGGWSKVGVNIAKSLERDLDLVMENVSGMLLDGVKHVSFVQDALDGVLSLAGNVTDEAVNNQSDLSLIQREGFHAYALLQERQAVVSVNGTGNESQLLARLTPVIMKSVHNVLIAVMDKVAHALQVVMDKLRPAFKQVQEWIVKFGDKIQGGIEVFTVTLDKVQKLFDQVMGQLHGKGKNEEEMLIQTFGLFDADDDGWVDAKDLHEVADMYQMTALQGKLPEKLVTKYDTSGEGKLSMEEMRKFVNDPAIPSAMPVMLRTYARRLAEVAGNVAAARQRDEVAFAVVQYFSVVCSKNMTKVGWVADRLGNKSLPLEFTADIMIQLCLTEDDPDRLTTSSVGQVVVGEMYRLHPRNTLEALNMLGNTTFWDSEGFNVDDQPQCVEKVTSWVTQAKPDDQVSLLSHLVSSDTASDMEAEMQELAIQALPKVAKSLAKEGVAIFLSERQHQEQRRNSELFHSSTHHLLLQHLTGGVSVRTATKGRSSAVRAAKAGQMARPETLEFAKWLAYNASSTAKERQHMCFEYSSESSSAMDTFATQIKAMVSQIQGFLDMMMKYSTPSDMDRLENQILDFADKGMQDLMKIVEKKLVSLLNNSAPQIENAVRKAAHKAGESLGRQIGASLGTPLGEMLSPAVGAIVDELSNSSVSNDMIKNELGKQLSDVVSNMTSEALAKQGGSIVEKLVDKALAGGADATENLLSDLNDRLAPPEGALLQLYHASEVSRRLQGEVQAFQCEGGIDGMIAALQARSSQDGPLENVADALSGAWQGMLQLLKGLVNTLPTAVSTLKYSRREVSKLSSNLDTIFSIFQAKGPSIFETISSVYQTIWVVYFIVMIPLNLLVLYYGFWAGGFFGGPQPIPEEEPEAPRTFRERCCSCVGSVCTGFQKYHDTQLCFWSVIILAQVFVLVLFIVSLALCLLAGVKAFILAGCDQIYVLGDDQICTESLDNIRKFVSSFLTTEVGVPVADVCNDDRLLTCNLIREKMGTSTIFTTVFSAVAAILSIQMILDSATLHEQARWRRAAHALYLKEAASTEGSARGSAA